MHLLDASCRGILQLGLVGELFSDVGLSGEIFGNVI